MKVLVTGATGFIGSHLAERLVEEGYSVRALVRQSGDTSLLEPLGVEIVYGDIRDAVAAEKAVGGCGQVYHLAAKTTRHRSPKQEYYEINVEGTNNIARAALKAGVGRLVYGSTVGAYGLIRKFLVDEGTETNPNTPYRKTKLLGEEAVLSYNKKEGLPVVIARISSVIGPRSLNWLGLFQTVAAGHFRMLGSGENHIQMGYVSDVVDGLRRCAEAGGIEGNLYIITGKEAVTLKQMVNMIAEESGVKISSKRSPELPFRLFHNLGSFVYRRFGFELPRTHDYELFLSNRVFNISKAQKELGYEPKVFVKEAIQQTVKWYRENGYI